MPRYRTDRPDVDHARRIRGRDIDRRTDACVRCVHWLPPPDGTDWGACELDRHKCTKDGLCALYYPAASDADLKN